MYINHAEMYKSLYICHLLIKKTRRKNTWELYAATILWMGEGQKSSQMLIWKIFFMKIS